MFICMNVNVELIVFRIIFIFVFALYKYCHNIARLIFIRLHFAHFQPRGLGWQLT